MKKKIYLVGAGGVGGHIAVNIASYIKGAQIAGFFDDDPKKTDENVLGYPVLGPVTALLKMEQVLVVIGIALPAAKALIIKKLSENKSLSYPSLIHERAWVSKKVSIGKGCVIYPGTTINYGSSLGDFVVLNMNCAIGHHTRIGSFSSLGPGVNTGGHTTIDKGVVMGIGSVTAQDVAIRKGAIIGGQSMILSDVNKGETVAGVPAKKIN